MNFALDHLLAIYQHLKLNQGEQMNEYLITVMKHIVSKMKNLSLAKKEEIILKLDDLLIINNAPEWIFKQNFIENIYYQMPELNSHILDTTSKILTNSLKSNFKNLREVNLRNNWPSTISITDHKIIHNVYQNSLIIPAFLRHSPLFKSSYPNFMNFASVGAIVGDELIQNFLKINSNIFLNEETSIKTNGRIKDFTKEYNILDMLSTSYHFPEVNDDNSGIRLAYLAYKLWEHDHGQEKILPGINYSIEELFFIFHGLTWCSSENSEYYSENHQYFRFNQNLLKAKKVLDAFYCENY